MYITIAAFAVLIVLVFLPDLVGNKKKKPADEEQASDVIQSDLDTANAENQRLKEELEKLKAEMAQKDSE